MRIRRWTRLAVFLCAALVLPVTARAQSYESVGTRAQGLGGAFVAVADDATATWWNPAGLAGGSYFNAVAERGRMTEPSDPTDDAAARRTTTTGFAFGFPALGLSYYRLRISEIQPIPGSTGSTAETRQEEGGQGVVSLAVNQFGVTVGQSLGAHLVIASTPKIVRAGEASSGPQAGQGLLDVGDDLDVAHKTRADLDAGVMATFNTVKLGLSVRNVFAPEFTAGGHTFTLERQVRAGVANISGRVGALDGVTLALDADVTKSHTVFGERQQVAGGAEVWFLHRRAGVRGGVSRNTRQGHQTTWAAGLSVGLTAGTFVEVSRAAGNDGSLRGWSATLRSTY